jgi:ABC-type amino acid transport substrate-binding protein
MYKLVFSVGVLLFAFSWGNADARAEQQGNHTILKVGAFNIPDVLDEKDNSIYSLILRKVSEQTKVPIKLQYFPTKRALDTFDRGEVDCLIPIDRRFFSKYQKFYQTKHLFLAKAYVFTRHGEKLRVDIGDLENANVAAQHGMQLGDKIEKNIDLLRVHTSDSLVKMLEVKRIDAFIAYVPDIYAIFEQLKIPALQHDPARPIVVHEDSLTCKITPQNKVLIERFDKGIQALHSSGYIRSVLGE